MPVTHSVHVTTIAHFHAALKSNLQDRTTQNRTLTICDINGKPFVTCMYTDHDTYLLVKYRFKQAKCIYVYQMTCISCRTAERLLMFCLHHCSKLVQGICTVSTMSYSYNHTIWMIVMHEYNYPLLFIQPPINCKNSGLRKFVMTKHCA